jgi:hypothetical protein
LLLQEVKCIAKCRKGGLDVPTVYRVDDARYRIYLEYIDGQTVRDFVFGLDLSKEQGTELCAVCLCSLTRCCLQIKSAVCKWRIASGGLLLLCTLEGEPTPAAMLSYTTALLPIVVAQRRARRSDDFQHDAAILVLRLEQRCSCCFFVFLCCLGFSLGASRSEGAR